MNIYESFLMGSIVVKDFDPHLTSLFVVDPVHLLQAMNGDWISVYELENHLEKEWEKGETFKSET